MADTKASVLQSKMGKISDVALKALLFVALANPEVSGFRYNSAVTTICEKIYNNSRTVDLMRFDSSSEFFDREVVQKCKRFPNQITILRREKEVLTMNRSSIIAMNSAESMTEFYEALRTGYKNFRTSTTNQQLYFVFEWGTYESFEKFYLDPSRKKWLEGYGFRAINQYFLVANERDKVSLLTIVRYTPKACNTMQVFEVNRYDKMSNKWQSGAFKVDKSSNFHGCNLLIVYKKFNALNSSPLSESDNISDLVHYGHIEKIIDVTSKVANFNVVFEQTFNPEEMAINTACYDSVPDARTVTFPFLYESHVIVTPLGEEYDCYEKLLLPFYWFVWLLIILTILSAIATVIVLSFTSISTRAFVYGTRITNPLENVTRIIFGLSQEIEPRRNFSRVLTMLFILFCLVMRTAWQGKLFEFMQNDMRKYRVKSYAEMVERDYVILEEPNEAILLKEIDDMGAKT